MPLTTAEITYSLANLVGVAHHQGTSVTATTNIPGSAVIDTDGDKIRLGSGKGSVGSDGSGTIDVWVPGTGSNPASWQTYIHVRYRDPRADKGSATRTFGPFTITGDANLADLVAEQEVPPQYAAGILAEMQALRDSTSAIAGADTADDLIVALDADSGSDFRVQQDARHSTDFAKLSGNNTLTGNQRVLGSLAVNATPSARIPFNTIMAVDAAAAGTIDKVAHGLVSELTGDLSTATGSNPTFAWGFSAFTTTGSAAGDCKGGNVQNLIETSIKTPAGTTIATAIGMMAEAAFFGASAGATVTYMTSMRVGSPKRKDGATAGTATNAVGLFIEDTQAAAVGATAAFALFVEGGISRFQGRVDVTDTIANNGTGDLNIYAGFSEANGGRIQIAKSGNGGHIRARMATSGAEFGIFDGTTTTFSISRTGLPKWNVAGNAQTTVGAAGAASALPATPTKYLKVVDSAGTTLVIPAYAAS